MNRCLVETRHPSPPSGNVNTHKAPRLAVFDCCSCGKSYCSCCGAKIRLCEQGLCCKSAARQDKKYATTVVVPSWSHGTPQQVPQRYEFDTGYQVPNKIFSVKALPHNYIQQTAVRAPRNKTCRSHGSSGPPAPPRSELIAAFGTTHYG